MTQTMMMAKRFIEGFIALMMGRQVPVHWNGRSSITRDGEICLPPPQTGEAAEIALLTRLAVHECGHLVHTEKGWADRLSSEELGIFNALEDPRMEKAQKDQYPGASVVLSRGLDELLPRIGETLGQKVQANPRCALELDLLVRGFMALAPHPPLVRHGPGLLELLAPSISAAERDAVDEAVALLANASGSLDAEQIARGLLARLKAAEQQTPPAEPDDDAGGNESAADQDAQQDPADADQKAAEGDQQEPQTPPEPTAQEESAEDNAGDQREESTPESTDDQAGAQPEVDQGGKQDSADPDQEAAKGDQQQPQMPPESMAQEDSAEDHAGDQREESAPDSANDQAGAQQANAGASQQTPDSEGGQGGKPEESGSPEAAAGGQSSEGMPANPGEASDIAGGSESSGESQAAPGQQSGDKADDSNQLGDQQSQEESSGQAEPETPSNGQRSSEPAGADNADGDVDSPLDLGALLREALAQRYGGAEGGEQSESEALIPMTGDELEKLRSVLAGADSDQSLEQLLEISLMALAGAEDGENNGEGDPGQGAGMFLAGPRSPDHGNALQSRLQGVQSRLVTVIQRELQDKKRQPTRSAHAGSRIMPQRFWRLRTLGDTKVFAKPRLAGGIDAAATVLVDSSYSMKERLSAAAEVALAFSLALQRLGVKTKVVRFPGAQTVTETLQRFGEPARACVQRCSSLIADGGTPVGAACILEMEELLEQRRLKNLLAVVTDDDPGDPETLAAAIAAAHDQDVLVVGVGIGCDIRAWIPTSVSVANVEELPDALRQLFRENISTKLTA